MHSLHSKFKPCPFKGGHKSISKKYHFCKKDIHFSEKNIILYVSVLFQLLPSKALLCVHTWSQVEFLALFCSHLLKTKRSLESEKSVESAQTSQSCSKAKRCIFFPMLRQNRLQQMQIGCKVSSSFHLFALQLNLSSSISKYMAHQTFYSSGQSENFFFKLCDTK